MASIQEQLRERLDFIQRNIAEGKIVGYYPDDNVNARLRVIKLTKLVCFNNAIVIGTCWEDYETITDRILYAYKGNGSPAAALVASPELKAFVNNQRRRSLQNV